MRAALTALTDELRRLKASGVKTVAVSDASVAALRRVLEARKMAAASAPVAARPSAIVAEPPQATAPVAPARANVTPSAPASAPAGRPAPAAAPAFKPYEPPPPTVRPARAAAEGSSGLAPIPEPPVVALPEGTKQVRWEALRQLVLGDPVCKAHVRPKKLVVFGVGNLDSRIMFVGEAPGAEEEVRGEPFVGPAGELLTKMIGGMGLKRTEVYIGNIMNWRPEILTVGGGEQYGNREPTEQEMRYCLPYLRAQIEVVQPELLVALGGTAAKGLLGPDKVPSVGSVRGKWHEFNGRPLMVTYHPSYILRSMTNRSKRMIWEDLLKVMERAELPISDKQRGYFLEK